MTLEVTGLLGLKIGTVVAGLVGGVASLAFTTHLTPKAGFTAVLGGAICAGVFTPAVATFLSMSGSMESALAFILGVCGMNLVGGLFKVSEAFRNKPVSTFKELIALIPFRFNSRDRNTPPDL